MASSNHYYFFQLLSDENKRKQFDTYGFTDDGMGGDGGGAGFNPHGFGGFGGGAGQAINLEDLFQNLFGGAAGGRGTGRRTSADDFFGGRANGAAADIFPPSDLRVSMSISFMESVLGGSKTISYKRIVRCSSCSGKGYPAGTKPISCSTCKGHGTVRSYRGPMIIEMTCNSCGGQGSFIKEKCSSCSGNGVTEERETVKVKIPRGM